VRLWELTVRLVLGPPTIQPDAALGHGPVARASGWRWRPVVSVPNWAGGWSLVSQAVHVQQDQILIQVNNPCVQTLCGLMRRPVPTPIGSSRQSGPQRLWSPQDNGVWGGLSADERRALKPRDARALRADPRHSFHCGIRWVWCVASMGVVLPTEEHSKAETPNRRHAGPTPADGGSRLPRDGAIGLIRTARRPHRVRLGSREVRCRRHSFLGPHRTA
jgi:hypothetical protein